MCSSDLSLQGLKDTNDGQIKAGERKVARLRKAAKKFHAKKGKINLIGPMMDNQAADLARDIAKAAHTQAVLARAIEILNDHTFDWSRQTKPGPQPMRDGLGRY